MVAVARGLGVKLWVIDGVDVAPPTLLTFPVLQLTFRVEPGFDSVVHGEYLFPRDIEMFNHFSLDIFRHCDEQVGSFDGAVAVFQEVFPPGVPEPFWIEVEGQVMNSDDRSALPVV